MKSDLENAPPLADTRDANRFFAKWFWASMVACLLTGITSFFVAAQILSQRYESRIRELNCRITAAKYALSPETMNRHREIARLLMHASKDDHIKNLPSRAFHDWLSIAEVSMEQNGDLRYEWINYTAKTDHPRDPDGDRAGSAWLIVDGSGCIKDFGYVSYEY